MKIRALALALVSSVFITPAFAADLPTANADIFTPTAVQRTYFHGAYIGVTGGFGAANNELNARLDEYGYEGDTAYNYKVANGNLDGIGAGLGLFGVNAGYDFRVGKFVFGPTIRYNWLSGSTDASVGLFENYYTAGAGFDYNNELGVGGRLGLMVSDKTLVYTGLLYSRLETSGSVTFDGETASKDYTFHGYTILAGIETMITPQLSLKLEGEYAQYGKETLFSYDDGRGTSASITAQPDIYDVKIGLTYRPNFAIDSLK